MSECALPMKQFLRRFGYSSRRRFLISLLRLELLAITSQEWRFRAYVFGSLANSKKEDPSDIDVLLCISLPSNATWRRLNDSDDLDIFPCQLRPSATLSKIQDIPVIPECHPAEKMIEIFNHQTAKLGEAVTISSFDCVEVGL